MQIDARGAGGSKQVLSILVSGSQAHSHPPPLSVITGQGVTPSCAPCDPECQRWSGAPGSHSHVSIYVAQAGCVVAVDRCQSVSWMVGEP